MRKKILIVCGYLNVGGAGKVIKFVCNSCKSEYDFHVLSFYDDEEPSGLDTEIYFEKILFKADWTRIVWRIKAIKKLRQRIIEIKPDIVCCFVSDIAFMTRLAVEGYKTFKFVSAERGVPYSIPPMWQKLTQWTYDHSDYCIFQLDRARNFFSKKVQEKSFVIANPFEPKFDMTPYTGERKKTIVSAGRFVAQKGYETLIDAFATVYKRHPEYQLILYGNGPDKDAYLERAEKLGIKERMQFPGYVKNVTEAVREDGVFVLSSVFEGIPNALIEAMSVGIPTVSADCSPGGADFLTNGGELGLLVPVGDSEKMADAICRVIEDQELSKKLSAKSICIKERLNPQKITSEWISIFATILK